VQAGNTGSSQHQKWLFPYNRQGMTVAQESPQTNAEKTAVFDFDSPFPSVHICCRSPPGPHHTIFILAVPLIKVDSY
jgi:hypothetical protein